MPTSHAYVQVVYWDPDFDDDNPGGIIARAEDLSVAVYFPDGCPSTAPADWPADQEPYTRPHLTTVCPEFRPQWETHHDVSGPYPTAAAAANPVAALEAELVRRGRTASTLYVQVTLRPSDTGDPAAPVGYTADGTPITAPAPSVHRFFPDGCPDEAPVDWSDDQEPYEGPHYLTVCPGCRPMWEDDHLVSDPTPAPPSASPVTPTGGPLPTANPAG